MGVSGALGTSADDYHLSRMQQHTRVDTTLELSIFVFLSSAPKQSTYKPHIQPSWSVGPQ